VRDRFQNEGAEPIGSTPKEFADMMQTESKRWAEVVKSAAITVE
jgi:tripartite-type tricarboxylate transporter receptor subunit TctC